MQKRHTNRERYFEEQAHTSRNYYIPYIKRNIGHLPDKVLEVGCGEGGNLLPFVESGCRVVGVDIVTSRIQQATTFYQKRHQKGHFIAADILELKEQERFPLIVIHDVIEHIKNKKLFLSKLKDHLEADGVIFIAFPAWQMPFGGHQQIAHSKIISHLPFIHLLPCTLYKWMLKLHGENEGTIAELLEIKQTKCTIEMFQSLAQKAGYQIADRQLYFINPHYQVKFGLSPRKLNRIVTATPYLRNFFSTSCFYILRRRETEK